MESDKLAPLRLGYLTRLGERVDKLAEFSATPLLPEARAFLHRAVHSMGSSAAIYGYTELSLLARAAERAFDDENNDDATLFQHVQNVIGAARVVLSASN